MGKILLQGTNIEQTFQVGDETVQAVQKISFQVEENTFNIIYGSSGSGKSTLLNILTGLQSPTRGTVLFEGVDVYKMKPDELAYFRANKLGIVYQTNYWVKSLNVIDNVSLPLFFLGYTKARAEKLALLALERVNMVSYAKKYPILMSGGEQQRAAVARAIVHDPLFIIADEPTGNLDSKNGDSIMNLLQNAKDEFRRTIILVTHNMEYLPLADKLLHIQDGVAEEVPTDTMQKTTQLLMTEMRERLSHYEKARNGKRVVQL